MQFEFVARTVANALHKAGIISDKQMQKQGHKKVPAWNANLSFRTAQKLQADGILVQS